MVQMGRTRRLKRVSWAPGVNLCQVRLFLSEDAPCQSGLGSQDHLQAKDSWASHASTGSTSDDSPLPPGFESVHSQNRPKTDISKISLIRWKCPPKIVLNPEWYVVSGEESQEIAKQNQRNFAVLEAIYPRQSTIPPNPSISAEAQESCRDDSLTRLVPLTAIEDDDPSDSFDSQAQSEPSLIESHQSNTVSHSSIAPLAQVSSSNVSVSPTLADMSVLLSRLGAHADVAAATAAAITALTSGQQGNLIDQDLLIKILSDPSLIEKLLPENRKPNPKPPQPTTAGMAMSAPLPVPPPLPPQHSAHLFNSVNDPNPRPTRPMVPTTVSAPLPQLPPPPLHHNSPLFNPMRNTNANPRPPQPMVTSTVSAPLPPPPPPRPHMIPSFSSVRPSMVNTVATPPPPPPPQIITTTVRPSPSVTPAKDANYYKSLIKQHGGENLGSTNLDVTGTGAGATQFKGQQHGVSGTCDGTKSKFQKPCAFFNTARGCRHGDSCMFLHDSSIKSRDERPSKRVKLDSNGIVGRI